MAVIFTNVEDALPEEQVKMLSEQIEGMIVELIDMANEGSVA